MPLRPNIPSLFGIKLSVAVDFLCPTFKNKPNDSPTRDHFQLPIQAFSIVGDRGITTGNFILYNFAQCKVRQIPKSGNFWSVESGTWKSFTCKIWNPGLWNLAVIQLKESGILLTVGIQMKVPYLTGTPKSSTWNVVPRRGIQNPRLSWIPLLCQ